MRDIYGKGNDKVFTNDMEKKMSEKEIEEKIRIPNEVCRLCGQEEGIPICYSCLAYQDTIARLNGTLDHIERKIKKLLETTEDTFVKETLEYIIEKIQNRGLDSLIEKLGLNKKKK